LITDLLYFN